MKQMADDDNTAEPTPGDLRKALEKALNAQKAMQADLDKYKAKERTNSVADILKSKGAPPAAARFYTAEAVDEASVSAWLEENKDLFPTSTASATTSTTPPGEQQTVNDPNADAARRVAEATATGGSGDDFVANAQGAAVADPAVALELLKKLQNLPRTAEGYRQGVAMGIYPPDPSIV